MGTEILNLQHQLEQAKSSLKDVDEHIKKLIGRDPSEMPPRMVKRPLPEEKGRPGQRPLNRLRNFAHENEEPPNKRKSGISVFNRLSVKVSDNMPAKGLISKVIVTNREVPSREEALQAQNKDEKSRARNRRMFGALLGTLQKFQQEETKLKQREDKRAQLEKKIEEHEIKEKEEVRRERQELFFNRKKKQTEIKVLELKMLRMREFSAWEESQKPRKSFLFTKAKPHVHYLPRRLTDKSKEMLEKNKEEIEELIEKKKQQISEEMTHIEERMKRNFEHRFNRGEKNETEEPEHETEEHLEDVLAETQMAIENEEEDKGSDQGGKEDPASVDKQTESGEVEDAASVNDRASVGDVNGSNIAETDVSQDGTDVEQRLSYEHSDIPLPSDDPNDKAAN